MSGTDNETVELYAKEPENYIPSVVNHPSIYMYNYGNEVYHGGNKSAKLAESMGAVLKRIKALDPTRPIMTQGSDDIDGRADVIGAHYWDYVYIGVPLDKIPAELRERTTRFQKVNWDRHKPVNVDEFSWILPRAGYSWYGEGSMKQTPFRQPGYRPDRLHDLYPSSPARARIPELPSRRSGGFRRILAAFHHQRKRQTGAGFVRAGEHALLGRPTDYAHARCLQRFGPRCQHRSVFAVDAKRQTFHAVETDRQSTSGPRRLRAGGDSGADCD
jgi:hypothetical protein